MLRITRSHLTSVRRGRCCPLLLQLIFRLQQVSLQRCKSCVQEPNCVPFPISQSLVNISRDVSSSMSDLTRQATTDFFFFFSLANFNDNSRSTAQQKLQLLALFL